MKENIGKYLIFVFVIAFILMLSVTIIKPSYRSLTTDSGFDSSWDSGGSWGGSSGDSWGGSSGGSWGGSSGDSWSGRSSGSGSYSNVNYPVGLLILPFIVSIFFVVAPIIALYKGKYNKDSSIMESGTTELLDKNGISKSEVIKDVSTLFIDLYKEASNGDINSIKDNFSSSLFEKVVEKFSGPDKEKISNITYRDGFVFNAENDESNINKLLIKLELCLGFKGTAPKKINEVRRYLINVILDTESKKYIFKKIELTSSTEVSEFEGLGLVPSGDVDKKLEEIGMSKEAFLNEAYDIYLRVQMAWMNDSLEDVRDVLSDEMINQYDAQLATLRVKNQQNVMEDFHYLDSYILAVSEEKDAMYFKVIMGVQCKDYLINKETKNVVRGRSSIVNTYRYSLVYMVGKNALSKCPECGAELKAKGSSTECEYCGSRIVRYSDNIVLVDKKMVSQS